MEDFLIYHGKVAIALMVFYIAFAVLFNRWKNFGFNRLYLMGSMIVSFIMPLITFTTIREVAPTIVYFESSGAEIFQFATTVEPSKGINLLLVLFICYLAGVAFLIARLLAGHLRAVAILLKCRKKQVSGIPLYICPSEIHPFAFFNKIVVPETAVQSNNLQMIINHEITHIRDKHWLDNLLSEIICALQWLNPFAWMMKKALKINLEFMADERVVSVTDAETYQLALVSMANTRSPGAFLTAINSSDLKTRIKMMKMKTENKYSIVKQLLVLPLLAILLMGLANHEVKTVIVQPEKTNEINSLQAEVQKNEEISFNDFITENTNAPSVLYASNTGSKDEKVITGKVIDEKGLPIEGASVEVKGRKYGVITDKKGNYRIDIQPADEILLFGYLFQDKEEIKIDGKDKIDVQLKTDGNPPAEGAFLHSSFRMRSKDGELRKPAYIVDGKEVLDINRINHEQIEQIEVLKGESGFKLYGEKGKNGVVLITTKNGEKQSQKKVSGNDLIIGNINWINNKKFSSNELTNVLGLKKGDEYLKEIIEERVNGRVSDLYMDNGYLFFNIETTEKQQNDKTIDLEFKIFEGNRGKIGKIEITGSTEGSTNEILNKIEIRSGDLFSRSKLIQSVRLITEIINQGSEVIDVEVNPERGNPNNEFYIVNLVFKIKGNNDANLITKNSNKIADEINGIQIKGNDKNPPLYLVDGKEVKNIADLKPENIEMIEVLKDKPATDLYGEKGKNGVILITMKDKTADNPTITNSHQLRRAIAERIKYPVVAQEAGQTGKIELFAEISRDGKIVRISETAPDASFQTLDEVVIVAYGTEKPVPPTVDFYFLRLLKDESSRVIKTLPKFEIPEFQGKWVKFQFEFLLQ